MNIKQQLEIDIREAMRNKDELRKRTLRLTLTEIHLAEVEKGSALDDPALMVLLQKEIKSRNESIADAERAGRPDLITDLRAEISVMEAYLPQQLSTQELEELARQAIADAGATSPKEMGQVMKLLVPRLQGRAPGNEASQVVRKLLEG